MGPSALDLGALDSGPCFTANMLCDRGPVSFPLWSLHSNCKLGRQPVWDEDVQPSLARREQGRLAQKHHLSKPYQTSQCNLEDYMRCWS